MRHKLYLLLVISLLLPIGFYIYPHHKPCSPEHREIAITIDDLPIDKGHFDRIQRSLIDHHAPAAGFVIASRVNESSIDELKQFQAEGFIIGNHTYSHPRLKNTTTEYYIRDIARADELLMPLIQGQKYFRYPHLSRGIWIKRKQVADYLQKHDYITAPVTIDSKDFKFNLELLTNDTLNHPSQLKELKEQYLDFVWEQTKKAEQKQRCSPTKQILLLHANVLNSYFLDDLLSMYEQKGYRFISLNDALGGTSQHAAR